MASTRISEALMARPKKLSLLSVEALFKLRDDVTAALSRKADAIKKELSSLGSDYAEVGRIAVYGRKSLKGRKVAAKYRDPKTGQTWSGRGAPARWITAYEKQGKKRDLFLVGKPAAKKAAKRAAKKARKRPRRKK
jgi:DNA-binding protein H-NS